jgi:KUP system potassium uptake protein
MGQHKHPLSVLGVIITLGIVFGDIGTSPLYVMRAIIGQAPIDEMVVLGGLSCVIWTLTLQSSIKYVWLALNAENNGEGGIFALYGLIRRISPKWMIYVAMMGCSALLADGIITPAISLTSAVEGLTKIYPGMSQNTIIMIVIVILFLLFAIQQLGTNVVGKAFGPITFLWFIMLAVLGGQYISVHPEVIYALNPKYAIDLLIHYPNALALIGGVFLCVTGAEALYADLGHCGKENIRISWLFVKISLILNYMGQGAWLLNHKGETMGTRIPFFEIFDTMPAWFIYPGVIMATLATIIASQALITGSFSLINEAIKLKLWFRAKIDYPSEHRSQLYIGMINWLLFTGCLGVVLYFRDSTSMEGAYGLAITIVMLVTTCLMMIFYHRMKHKPLGLVVTVGIIYIIIELGFLYSNILKIPHGAWVSLVIMMAFFATMFIHYRASRIRSKAIKYEKVDKYKQIIVDMSNDESIPEYAQHLVYMVNANRSDEIEYSVLHSMLFKEIKRAQVYWFVNIHVADEPYSQEYKVHHLIEGKLYRIDFYLGYRVHPSINVMFNQVVEEMEKNGEIKIESPHPSLQKHNLRPAFKYIATEKVFAFDDTLKSLDKVTVKLYEFLNRFSINAATNYDLNSENLVIEEFPIRVREQKTSRLKRKA